MTPFWSAFDAARLPPRDPPKPPERTATLLPFVRREPVRIIAEDVEREDVG